MVMLNGIIVTFTTLLNAVFGMIEVSVFLKYYGATVNGLIQTGNQILNYLALIEAGLSAAYLYKMYKPMADNDYKTLSEYYTGFKKNMTKTVNLMLIAAVVVSAIYPFFLKNERLGYINVLSIFILMSLKVILPYKVTMVPKYMLIVHEQKYKAEFISGLCRSVTYLTEMLIIVIVNDCSIDMPVQVILFCDVLIAYITGILFDISMKKIYGEKLNPKAKPNSAPNKMSKDILVHNISSMVFSSTDNVIISTMGSLEEVTVYSSYNMVVGQVIELAQKFMDGITASLGIKIAHHDKNSYDVYREMMAGSFWLAGIIGTVFIAMMNSFVELWIGKRYCVSLIDLFLFGLVLYCGIILPCIQTARNACGLYKESKKFTAIQAVMNLVITIVLVPSTGITGALLGTVIARITITVPCNYNLVNKKVFPENNSHWIELILSYVLYLFMAYGIYNFVRFIPTFRAPKIIIFLTDTGIVMLISMFVYSIYYWIINTGFREFIFRLQGMLKNIIDT